jgi:hypothetical protein
MSEEIRRFAAGEEITAATTLVHNQATSWGMDRCSS